MLGCKKSFGYRMVEKLDEPIVVSCHVQEATGLQMQTELRPGKNLGKLFQGSDAPRKGDKAIGEVCHLLFAFVHGTHNAEFR